VPLYIEYMSALFEAYAEYLERMLEESLDLVEVDENTVPINVDLTGPITEWADLC
jgi:hypothetical protein